MTTPGKASPKSGAVKEDQLNRLAPAARDAQLGTVLADLIAQHNALLADVNALRAAYTATGAAPAATALPVAPLADR